MNRSPAPPLVPDHPAISRVRPRTRARYAAPLRLPFAWNLTRIVALGGALLVLRLVL
jgi:hypothetical protein